MRTISNEIIKAMPIDLINELRTKAISLMSGLMDEMEMRFNSLTTEEINFFKVLQSINTDQERFDGMCVAFGKLMYPHQAIEDTYDMSVFQSRMQNQHRLDNDDIPKVQE